MSRTKYAKHVTFLDQIKAQLQPVIAPSNEYATIQQQSSDYLDKKALVRAGDAGESLSLQEQLDYKRLKEQGF